MIFQEMDRIVFAGDSVTDMGSEQPVGEGLFENPGPGASEPDWRYLNGKGIFGTV